MKIEDATTHLRGLRYDFNFQRIADRHLHVRAIATVLAEISRLHDVIDDLKNSGSTGPAAMYELSNEQRLDNVVQSIEEHELEGSDECQQ